MIVKLSEIAEYSKGQQINGDELIADGIFDYLNGGVNPSGKWNSSNVCGNTVTISEGGNSSGYVNYMEKPFWCGAHCYYLYNIKGNSKYLYYALKSQQDRIMGLRSGACMPNIKKSDLGKFELIYSFDDQEQSRITTVLDKVTDLIAKHKRQLELLDELVQARFVEMFGDPNLNPNGYDICKLKRLTNKISDGVHAKPTYTMEGKPFISVVNINKGTIDFSNCKYVSEEAYQKMIKSTFPEFGDVLYTKVGATYGIPAYVDTHRPFCLYVSVSLIKPKHDKINAKFLSLSMAMPYVKRQADERIKGIGVPDLHLNQIKEFEILCPPRKEQDEYVLFVEQTDKSKAQVQKSLEQLETLKKALMQQYFG